MKLTRDLVFRPISWVMTAGLLVAALGMACLDGTDEAAQKNGAGATTAQSTAAMEYKREGSPGVSEAQVLFGQSAAFTGPARELGKQMLLGIEAAFHEANQAGGVHGRQLKIEALDDAYEDDYAYANTERLIEVNRVFALIGAVGTPTSRAASPPRRTRRGCRFWPRSPARSFCATQAWTTCSTSAPRTTRRPRRWWPASRRIWA